VSEVLTSVFECTSSVKQILTYSLWFTCPAVSSDTYTKYGVSPLVLSDADIASNLSLLRVFVTCSQRALPEGGHVTDILGYFVKIQFMLLRFITAQ
jgi:hypothetical protein